MNALLAALCLSSANIADFFPLVEGASWTYLTTPEGTETTDTVGKAMEHGGKAMMPIVTKFRNRVMGSTYYRVDGNTVWTVAFDRTLPLKDNEELKDEQFELVPLVTPHPILRWEGKRTSWDYKGTSPFMGTNDPFEFKATSQLVKLDVLGEATEAIEVKMDVILANGTPYRTTVTQTARYARGIGLVSMDEETRSGNQKVKRSIQLIRYSKP